MRAASLRRLPAAMLACVALSSAALADEVSAFEGTWLHLGDRYGLVGAYVEAVRIGPDGAVEGHLYRVRSYDPVCQAQPAAQACLNPQVTERGTLAVEPATRALKTVSLTTVAAYENPMVQQWWQVLRFASEHPWIYSLGGDMLRLERRGEAEGDEIVVAKLYHRVDPDMPADLFDFLTGLDLSILRASCAIDHIQADPRMRQEFRVLIAELAPAVRSRDMEALREFYDWITQDPDNATVLYPGAVGALPAISACIDEFM